MFGLFMKKMLGNNEYRNWMIEVSIHLYEAHCDLRWLNTVLAVSEYTSFAKLWHEKSCSSQAETWQVENILMKDFD